MRVEEIFYSKFAANRASLRRMRPNGLIIVAFRSQLPYLRTIGKHRVNLRLRSAFRRKHKVEPIGRPRGMLVAPGTVGQLD